MRTCCEIHYQAPGHALLDCFLFAEGPRAGYLDVAGKAEEPPSLAKGLAGHAAAAGDDRVYQSAWRTLFLLSQGRRRQAPEHLRFCLRRKSEQEPRAGNVPDAR